MDRAKHRRLLFSFAIVIITMIFTSFPTYILYLSIKNTIVDEIGKNSIGIATAVSEVIMQNIDEYEELYLLSPEEGVNYDSIYYQDMLSSFRTIKENSKAAFIYTEKLIDNETVMYILDSEDPSSENFSKIGSLDIISSYELEAYQTLKGVYSPLEYYDDWGRFVSGYVPIINPETGEVYGLVGVDFSDDYYMSLMKNVLLIMAGLVLFISILSSYLINRLIETRTEALNEDYLTGLYSKRYLDNTLKKKLIESKVRNHPLTLMMIDVDSFKQINDQYGHMYGDEILKEIAEVISINARNIDVCSRYGGDEFLIIFPNTLPENAALIAENILHGIHKINVHGTKGIVSVSIGISLWDHFSDASVFISKTDKAMYHSKEEGKDRLSILE